MYKLSTRTFVSLLLMVTVFAASSCKKEDVSPTRIKTITYTDTQGSSSVTENYEYDDMDRLSKVFIEDSLAATYQYQDLTVVQKTDGGNTVYTLNSDGYVSSVNFYYSTLMDFYYGSPGYVSQTVNGNVQRNFVWSGENLVQNYGTDTVDYTYLTDKSNTIGNEYRGLAFLGKDAKNLVNTVTYSTGPTTLTYAYEYDGDKVSKRTLGTAVEIYTYY